MTTVIGRRFLRADGPEKVTGQARYGADLGLIGMLHARFLYAEHPHARILSIDTSVARALDGVHAVITQEDVPDVRYGMFVKDRTLFARDVVRFEAEIVAAVAAETAELADRACALIDVAYEPLEPVLDPLAALAPGSPQVHPGWQGYGALPDVVRAGNDCGFMTTVKGDVERGFADSDVVVSETYRTDMSHAVPIEPHAVVAQWQGDRVTVWSSTQVPFPARGGVAETLQIPQANVRIVVPHLGGGFGGKCDFHFEAHVAALARVTGRPVRLVLTREEEFLATDKVRHPFIVELTTGVKRDGTITARRARLVLDSGAYVGDALFATEIGLMMVGGPYRIPHLHAEAHTVYTNRTPCGSVRAPGGPQVCWAVEQHTDAIAERLGVDPIELRRRNLVRDGDTGQTGQVFEGVSAIRVPRPGARALRLGPRPARGGGPRGGLRVVVQPARAVRRLPEAERGRQRDDHHGRAGERQRSRDGPAAAGGGGARDASRRLLHPLPGHRRRPVRPRQRREPDDGEQRARGRCRGT